MKMEHKEILRLLEKLISFKSVTPKGIDALEYISGILGEIGFECEIKSFGHGEEETYNLYAQIGSKAPNICFAGHVDVVPPLNLDLWKHDPFEMNQEGDKVYGRGAVDMKGSIACFIASVKNFLDQNKDYQGSLSMLLTTDEEGHAKYGVQKMLPFIYSKGRKIDFCIVGEPTTMDKIGDTIKIGRRGSINFDLQIQGLQGHVAYPNKAMNPINQLIAILHELQSTDLDHGSEFFQQSILTITSADVGNQVSNVIPEFASAKFNIRFNDQHTKENLIDKIEAIIKKYSSKYILDYNCSAESFIQEYTGRIKEFVAITEEVCKAKPNITTSGGTSDARFIHKYCQLVEFGLNCGPAHKINEFTEISDLQMLYNVYYCCISRFLQE